MAEQEIIETSGEVLEDLIKLLAMAWHPNLERIHNEFRAHANAFSMHRLHMGNLPTIHEDAARMRKLERDCASCMRAFIERRKPKFNQIDE